MNRQLRTLLPNSLDKQKLSYDKSARDLKPLTLGQNVRLYENQSWSRKGKIVQVGPEIRSYRVLTDKDTVIRCNRRHLLPTDEQFTVDRDNHEEYINETDSQDLYNNVDGNSEITETFVTIPSTDGDNITSPNCKNVVELPGVPKKSIQV